MDHQEVPDVDASSTSQLWAHVVAFCHQAKTSATSLDSGYPDRRSACESDGSDDSIDSVADTLRGSIEDPLLPDPAMMDLIWDQAQSTWTSFVVSAKQWPRGFFNTCAILGNTPAIPHTIPDILEGNPMWRVSDIAARGKVVVGGRKRFVLSYQSPVKASISNRKNSSHYGKFRGTTLEEPPKGLTILVFCWSYILSAMLLERQGLRAVYTNNWSFPHVGETSSDLPALRLPSRASNRLVRWLCALFDRRMGWKVAGRKGYPPWALWSTTLILTTTTQHLRLESEQAPSSEQALQLLHELYSLFELHSSEDPMPALQSSFMAALAIPYYRYSGLKIQLPAANLAHRTERVTSTHDHGRILQDYYLHMPHYMTISLHPLSYRSILWSVFWQPHIRCNVVSSWLNSTLKVLEPVIAAKDLGRLARIFAARRPLPAMLWLAVFLLGDHTVIRSIEYFLRSLQEEKDIRGAEYPDITVSAWTRCPQSFWDDPSTTRPGPNQYSRREILQRRLNLQLSDDHLLLFAWEPFSDVSRECIEPDFYDYLESKFFRHYEYWRWRGVKTEAGRIQRGFSRDHKVDVAFEDNLVLLGPDSEVQRGTRTTNIAPSKRATLPMINFSMLDSRWDRTLDNAAIPGLEKRHPWLRKWRGLE
ncbi:hypothetical protein Micbo1qcDRAFT_154054 [Microdochium bolleyi]|uniref:Uncharacterized protein n=1 Tax=Microdochium bolleyi TaxID=196109 RepID=A0A136IKY6_9PEZI|nr:hypothetical protein Micbo1qcDRAFT_154054 [Microdochium bolleyi]